MDKTSLSYLYNGVKTLALPEWNKETYPYACMDFATFANGERNDKLYVFTTPIFYKSGSTILAQYTADTDYAYLRYYISSSGEWESDNEPVTKAAGATMITSPFGWSSFDILNTDGTLYLAASEPIPILAPTLDPLSLFLGWKAGNWVARQRGKKKQPVAFLYNGVRLPELPEWDKTVYPYAVILSSQSTYANLIVSTVPLYYTPVKSGFSTTHRLGAKADGSMLAFVYDSTNDDEVKRTSFVRDPDRDVEGFTAKENVKTLTLTSPKWANYDLLYYADDTVCVTASEPVPVYD